MFDSLKILIHQGKQYIPDVRKAEVPGIFRGRPVISTAACDNDGLCALCPTGALSGSPLKLDLGKCVFCGRCARSFPEKIRFTKDYRMAVSRREDLVIREGQDQPLQVAQDAIRREVKRLYRRSLKLRQVSAGGDNSCEWELNACGNVNFDMGRFGIEFVASPRHADGIVITGPISANMSKALEICYEATPDPRLIILAGTDAISGGILQSSPALDRSFLDNHAVDLYIPGNPPHPLVVINGLLDVLKKSIE